MSILDLIDTLWNVKEIHARLHASADPDLIDTLWNVKQIGILTTGHEGKDLIDTLWNVKREALLADGWIEIDLIDTLWNVKGGLAWDFLRTSGGFNRYIVECKGRLNNEL